MKTKFSKRIISLVLALIILVSLTACDLDIFNPKNDPIDKTKEQILSSIEESISNDTADYEYVYRYLVLWGISGFDSKKVGYYEDVFQYFYEFEDGLPDTLTHAADTAKLFIENYYDKIDLTNSGEVTDAILNCYVYSVGDPYSYYRTAEEFEEFQDDMSGTFGGVGIQIEYNHTEKTLMVNQVFKDGPADVAGMKVGDYIIGVDGKSLDELGGYDKAVNFVRGKIGTEVTVTVNRNGQIIDIKMIRAIVVEKSVEYQITDDGYGYVAISSFKSNTAAQFREAINALEDAGVSGYIFDVRSNPGGYVQSVVDVLSYILPTGKTVISCHYKNEPTDYYTTTVDDIKNPTKDHVINLPMVVICNEYTASAGEIFVSCLKDYEAMGALDDVVIVGKNTFGKGIMQASLEYKRDHSYVTLTIAYYNPPSGINYHGIGIAPDITVELSETEDTQLAEAIVQLGLLLKK